MIVNIEKKFLNFFLICFNPYLSHITKTYLYIMNGNFKYLVYKCFYLFLFTLLRL